MSCMSEMFPYYYYYYYYYFNLSFLPKLQTFEESRKQLSQEIDM